MRSRAFQLPLRRQTNVALRSAPQCRHLTTSDRTVQEYDVLLLKQKADARAKWRLTPPLRKGKGKVKLHHGANVDMDQLIGRRMMDKLKDSSGRDVVIYEPSMATYIVHGERHAVPIYPHDASTIVAMMDLHPEHPGEIEDDGEPFEVFEAGTGMGSLTLHIARALHAGNPSLSKELREAIPAAKILPIRKPDASSDTVTTATLSHLDLPPHLVDEAQAYPSTRRAILHTLDRKALHSFTAHGLVRRFRRGIYLPTIDFHTGSIDAYLTPRLADRDGKPFLSRAVLDLPAPEENAAPVVRALRPNATLIVFSPSISQIAAFAAWSARERQPLRLDRTAELPTSSSADYGVQECEGGRSWNVSTVVPKDSEDGRVVQIMRPRMGDRVAGGGFVAVFRKIPEDTEPTIGNEEAAVEEAVAVEVDEAAVEEAVIAEVEEAEKDGSEVKTP